MLCWVVAAAVKFIGPGGRGWLSCESTSRQQSPRLGGGAWNVSCLHTWCTLLKMWLQDIQERSLACLVMCAHLCAVVFVVLQFDESLIASLANEDLVDSLLAELQEDYPQLLKPLLHDRWDYAAVLLYARGEVVLQNDSLQQQGSCKYQRICMTVSCCCISLAF